jgi:hypothetical protein
MRKKGKRRETKRKERKKGQKNGKIAKSKNFRGEK